jgi:hypothetical protein
MFNETYKSLNPTTSLDSGNACISINSLLNEVDVILIGPKIISPFK